MQRRYKAFILLTMVSVAIYTMIERSLVEGTGLFMLALGGLYIIEVREINRYSEGILNKLFVCVDLESYKRLYEALARSLIFLNLRRDTLLFYQELPSVFRESVDLEKWKKLNSVRAIPLYRGFSRALIDGKTNQFILESIERWASKKAKKSDSYAYLKWLCQVKTAEAMAVETDKLEAILSLRAESETNLEVAYLSDRASKLEGDTGRCNYYKKSAQNIAPEFFGDKS